MSERSKFTSMEVIKLNALRDIELFIQELILYFKKMNINVF